MQTGRAPDLLAVSLTPGAAGDIKLGTPSPDEGHGALSRSAPLCPRASLLLSPDYLERATRQQRYRQHQLQLRVACRLILVHTERGLRGGWGAHKALRSSSKPQTCWGVGVVSGAVKITLHHHTAHSLPVSLDEIKAWMRLGGSAGLLIKAEKETWHERGNNKAVELLFCLFVCLFPIPFYISLEWKTIQLICRLQRAWCLNPVSCSTARAENRINCLREQTVIKCTLSPSALVCFG